MSERSKAIKACDKAFSRFVRLSCADKNGYVSCITCQKLKFWKEVDCGHFQTRSKYSVRWLYDPENGLINASAQCKHCNLTNGGHQYKFAQQIDILYGSGQAQRVAQMSNVIHKYTLTEIRENTRLFEGRAKELEERF